MTRWARANNAHRKQPSEATAWQQLKRRSNDSDALAKRCRQVDSGGEGLKCISSESGFSLLLKKNRKEYSKPKPDSDDNTPHPSNLKYGRDDSAAQPGKRKEQRSSGFLEANTSKRPSHIGQVTDISRADRESDIHAVQLSAVEKKRLQTLRKQLNAKGIPRTEVLRTMRREKSKSLRAEKRRAKICFKCRQFGHVIATCPNADAGTGICFRCGSTEHMSKDCRTQTRTGQGAFPFATCFVCGEQGHLSSACPDNPDGLYPNGGCCHECGSVKHLRKDCPDLQMAEEESSEIILHVQDQWGSADAEVVETHPERKRNKGPKIIAFK